MSTFDDTNDSMTPKASVRETKSAVTGSEEPATPIPRDNTEFLKRARLTKQRKALDLVRSSATPEFAFYRDGATAYLKTRDGRVHPITKDSPGIAEEITRVWEVLPSQYFYRHVVSQLEHMALIEGSEVTVRRLAYYDQATRQLYVSKFDGQMFVLAPHQPPRLSPNGTDGVLFLDDPTWQPYGIPEGGGRLGPTDLLDAIWEGLEFETGTLTPEEQAWLFLFFGLALFFPELMPTRVMLVLGGEKGSGKSYALKRFGRLLFGPGFDVTGLTADLRDLDAILTNQHFVAIDNVDTPVNNLLDRLAGAATGQAIARREYYTTNRPVTFRTTAFLAMTTRTPHFQRDDIADRVLPLRLQRRRAFQAESELLREFDAKRDECMGWMIALLGLVVTELALNPTAGPTELRIADFGAFAERIAPLFGIHNMRDILSRVRQVQEEFTNDGDPILELLENWVQDNRNGGRRVSLKALREELLECARAHGLLPDVALRDQRSFGHAISQRLDVLKKRYGLEAHRGHARTRYLQLPAHPPTPLLTAGSVPRALVPGEEGEEGDEVQNERKEDLIN